MKDKIITVSLWVFYIGLIVFASIGIVASVRYVWSNTHKPAYSIYDLDRNGLVNSSDTNICYDIFTGHRLATPEMLERADVTGDGLVDDKDCTMIMDAVLGKVEK